MSGPSKSRIRRVSAGVVPAIAIAVTIVVATRIARSTEAAGGASPAAAPARDRDARHYWVCVSNERSGTVSILEIGRAHV